MADQKNNQAKIRYVCLLFCFLALVTLVIGSCQASGYFNLSHKDKILSINQSWFYFVYSSSIGIIFVRHIYHLITLAKSLNDKSVFILIHSYMTMFADMALLLYYFCVAVQLTDLKFQVIFIYCTLLARIALCYIFIKFVQSKYTH